MLPILTRLLSDMPRKMHASRRHSTINSLLSSPTQSCQDVEGRKGTSCCLPNIQTYQASDQPARFPRTKQQSQTSPNGNRPAYMSRGWASRNGISRHQDKRATLESFGNAHGTRAVDGSPSDSGQTASSSLFRSLSDPCILCGGEDAPGMLYMAVA